jgi:hypothetical protein
MKSGIGLSIIILCLTACEAFKGQGATIDTAAVGPTPEEPSSEPSDDTDTDDTDTDDTDTEDTEETDTSDPNELDCKWDPEYNGTLSNYPCVGGYIWEGETVDGSTTDESNYFNKDHYSSREWYCETSFDGEYDSSERTFIFLHPGTGFCYAELETRCGDFDLIGLRYDVEANGCPVPDQSLPGADPCQMSATRGLGRTESLTLYENTTLQIPYLLIIDAPNLTEEWFRFTVTCD